GFSGDAFDEIQELQHKLQSNSTIMELVGRQQDVISLIQEINQTISIAAGFDFGQSSSSGGTC
ncbi:YlbF family regulator, partial [bacterium]|nr:YlbF family regulator [bacterium]